MKWKKLINKPFDRNELPKNEPFLALWKGGICLVEYCEDENCFYACNLPAQSAGLTRISHEREGKFTHFCEIEFPEDY